MPLRLYLLYGLGQLVPLLGGSFHAPLPPVTMLLIKLPGLLADLLTIGIIYAWSLRWLSRWQAAALALLYALAPPVWMNVAWWGQVDALLVLPLIGMVLLLAQAGGRWSWLCWTVALLIKPQAIVLAPLLYVATLRLHGSRGVAQGGALALSGFVLACVPLALAGQGAGLMQAYFGSVGRFPMLTAGAYNLWYLVTLGAGGHDTGQGFGGISYRLIGMALVALVALVVGGALLRRADSLTRLSGAAVLALAFFALPTQIHERYLFLALAFIALLIPAYRWLVLVFVVLVASATLNILGTLDGFVPLATAWIAASPLPLVLALVNLGILALLVGVLIWQTASRSRTAVYPTPRTAAR
jgi:Gpi18-like mannosyltransferase